VNIKDKENLAYVIGVALGDGNLSNPNKRAIRLRVTCDSSYQQTANEITQALKKLLPNNKVSHQRGPKDSYFNISVYSNKLGDYMPWKVGYGSKFVQQAHVPKWITTNKKFTRACLRGLIQTDGSIYMDRGYRMINFTNIILPLAEDTKSMIEELGYKPHLYNTMQKTGNIKYTVRLSVNVDKFIAEIKLSKT